jgi:hypothetical protein
VPADVSRHGDSTAPAESDLADELERRFEQHNRIALSESVLLLVAERLQRLSAEVLGAGATWG